MKPRYNQYVNKILQPCLCIYLLTEWTQPYKFVVNQLESNPIAGIGIIIGILIGCLAIGQVFFYIADKSVGYVVRKVCKMYTIFVQSE